jgi:hypothetical protein
MLVAECLVECLEEWAEWVEWVEWECNHSKPLKVFKNAREINLFGVFFCFHFSMFLQCLFNVSCFAVFR